MTQLYTSSRLKVLRACLRLHYYRYVLGVQMPSNDAAQFGTVGHRALEAWYRTWMAAADEADFSDRRVDALSARLPAALSVVDASDLSPFDRTKLSVLIRAYDARWGAEDWEILAVEVEFRYLLGDAEIGGKIDVIIRDRKDGRIYVVEHKTTGTESSLGGTYWERLTLDSQVSIYIDGASILGHEIAGCIYDVIKRPAHEQKLATPEDKREYTKGKGCKGCGGSGGGKDGIVQGRGYYTVNFASVVDRITCDRCKGTGWLCDKEGVPQAPRLYEKQRDTDETVEEFEARLVEAIAESPDAFLMRGVVVRLDHELPAMRQDVLDDIELARSGLRQRNPDSCSRYGTMCPMFSACVGQQGINEFPRGPVHPELEAAF